MGMIPRGLGGPSGPVAAAVAVEEFGSPAWLPTALETILQEFTERWERGERPCAEEYLGELDPADPAAAIELIYHEYRLAEIAGLGPDWNGFLGRFPAYRDRLVRLFGLRAALGPPGAELPEAGDALGPYHLQRELGRGTFARVFLAEQADLDDRLVVVKVSNRPTAEPRLLARCRHPHIVEVLRHGATADEGLRFVCMPFLGGATLAAVLGVRRRCRRARSGRDLLDDLDQAGAPEYAVTATHRPARVLLARLSYPQALAWSIARLAEALEHAWRRGVTHGDLKPSNILLTADAVPMLLDFNLALDWSVATGAAGLAGGGTLAYMAPERLRALSDAEAARPTAAVRHRADIYALGLVLLEALGGPLPDVAALGNRPLPELASALAQLRSRPRVVLRMLRSLPAGLRPIAARCLAPEPADRYATALHLAEDLERYLANQPPIHARRRSPLAPWLWRQRRALAVSGLVLIAGSIAAGLVALGSRRSLEAVAAERYEAYFGGLEPGVYDFRRPGVYQADLAEHQVRDALRHLRHYRVLERADWRQGELVRALAEPDRAELEAWLLGQALVVARWHGEHPDAGPAETALALEALERSAGKAVPMVFRPLIAQFRARLDRPEFEAMPDQLVPAWVEDYLRGLALERDRPIEALRAYEAALKRRPGGFWASYRAAVVAGRIGEFRREAIHLDSCLARFPDNPALRLQYAAPLERLGLFDLALAQCDLAVQRAPDNPLAYRSRSILRHRLGQEAAGRTDFDRFQRLARQGGQLSRWSLSFELSRFGGAEGVEPTSALIDALERRVLDEPEDFEAWSLRAELLARSGQVQAALREYQDLLSLAPDHLRARLAHAELLRQQGRAEALSAFETLLSHPRFPELVAEFDAALRVYHHVAYARLELGQVDEALAVARRGLAESRRLGRLQGESLYALARTYAVAARDRPAHLDDSSDHLQQAARRLPVSVRHWFARDPAFDGLRDRLGTLLEVP